MIYVPTKEELEEYRFLLKEIKQLEDEIDKIEVENDVVKGSEKEYPFTYRTVSIKGKNNEEMLKVHSKLIKQKNILTDKRKQLEDFFETIENSEDRCIFRMRYIKNMKWLKISMEIGNNYSDYARIKHDRYLDKRRSEYIAGIKI